MTPTDTPMRRRQALWLGILLATGQLSSVGCAWSRWGQRGDDMAFGKKVPCRLPPDATAEDYVDHINQNVDRLHGWRGGAKLRANGMPELDAQIAVEKDQHLRILVSSMLGPEIDLGCNDDVFWFWAKRQQPAAVMYAKHEQLDRVRESLRIPFEPSWLMEAFGIASLNAEGMTLERLPDKRSARLVSNVTLANGRTVRKTITVDTCHGRVLEHAVADPGGQTLAQAAFFNHRVDPDTGIVMPHHIRLNWPQSGMALRMDLGKIEVNPAGVPTRTWEMPQMPEYPPLNLEDVVRRERGGPPRQPATTRVTPASHEEMDEGWQSRRVVEEDPSLDEPEFE